MGKRSRGVEVHKKRSLKLGGSYTACGHIYFEPRQVTKDWRKVTCENCLPCRKPGEPDEEKT